MKFEKYACTSRSTTRLLFRCPRTCRNCYITGGGEQVRRVAGQQDPPVPVALGLPGFEREPRQPDRFSQGQVRAEHAANAVLEFGDGHGCVVVVLDQQRKRPQPALTG
nr:hypothetical protein [Streptomyces sp. A1-5]